MTLHVGTSSVCSNHHDAVLQSLHQALQSVRGGDDDAGMKSVLLMKDSTGCDECVQQNRSGARSDRLDIAVAATGTLNLRRMMPRVTTARLHMGAHRVSARTIKTMGGRAYMRLCTSYMVGVMMIMLRCA